MVDFGKAGVEARILDLVDGRLLIDTREFKELPGIGVVSAGCLGRLIQLARLKVIRREVNLSDLLASLDRAKSDSRHKSRTALAKLTRDAPILLYAEHNGRPVLIDGAQRLLARTEAGLPTIEVIALLRDDVERFKIADPKVDYYRTLQRLEFYPIDAVSRSFRDASVVQLRADYSKRRRGGQTLSPDAKQLRQTFRHLIAALLDLEHFIHCSSHVRSHALFPAADELLKRKAWVDWVYPKLNRAYFSSLASYSTIANLSHKATSEVTDLHGHAERKKTGADHWSQRTADELVEERDRTLQVCVATLKAYKRAQKWPAVERQLVEREYDQKPLRHAHLAKIINDLPFKIETELSLAEQILVTAVSGVNLSQLYFDFTTYNPLFEAYAYAYAYRKCQQAKVDPGMIETSLHRRALAILGQTDGLSELWSSLFTHWATLGIDDAEMLRILAEVDRALGNYAPVTIRRPQRG